MRSITIFSTTYCGPCKALKRRIYDAGITAGIEYIDCMEQPTTAERYHIKHVPTAVMFEDGREKQKLSGSSITIEKIKEWLGDDTK